MQLGETLVEQGVLTPGQLVAALEALRVGEKPSRLRDWLVARSQCSETDVLGALGQQFSVPVLNVIPDEAIDSSLVQRLPVDWSRTRNVLPIRWKGRVIAALCDPAQEQDVADLSLLLGDELGMVLAPHSEIRRATEKCYYDKKDDADAFLETLAMGPADQPMESGGEDLLRMADNAPVTQLVNLILLDAMKSGASDVHIEPYARQLRLRFRIDGILYERTPPPKHIEAALVSRLKVMAHLDIAEKRMPQDGAARVRVGEREIDIRTSTVPVADGERIVLRILNRDATLLPLSDLGMSEAMRRRFQVLLKEPFGVIWVTGPTGSGKTTTLYAALQELDTRHLNVFTIEDPVEYQLPTISQMSVNPKIGLTFARGLRHVLRQDPDVILVGETRDTETAEIVVRSALTGHLVFSTLHTNDAASAAIRLIEMGVEPYLVAAATRAAMAQRLVRTLCPECRRETPLTDSDRAMLGSRAKRLAGRTLWGSGEGAECVGGYRGRIGMFELMEIDAELQDIIRQGAHLSALRSAAAGRGTASLLDDGLEKVLEGRTSLSEVLRVVGQGSHANL